MESVDLSMLTPLMQQYFQLRVQHADAILLFQVGDFYELFFDDAQKASAILGIALTKRGSYQDKPIPLCGFPVHVLDHYVSKLIKAGYKVALCQQLEQAVTGKMVPRGVTQVFTPGTLTDENQLEAKKSSYLFAFFPTESAWGLLFSELLSSQLHATILPVDGQKNLETELYRFLPDEVLLQVQSGVQHFEDFFKQRGFFTTKYAIASDEQNLQTVATWSQKQFSQDACDYLRANPCLEHAIALWHSYVSKNQKDALQHGQQINFYSPDQFLMLDAATQKNLDIVVNSFDNLKEHSLIGCMDRAVTPMGSRMIRRWLLRPLVDFDEIYARQQVVRFLVARPTFLSQLIELLEQLGDLQRIVGRIALQKAGMKDYLQLGVVTGVLPELSALVSQAIGEKFEQFLKDCVDLSALHTLLMTAFNRNELQPEWLIAYGFDTHLDHLRDCIAQTDQQLLQLEAAEQARTGIASLKIRQNNVQGFYIEVTKVHTHLVPQEYIRQQTLVGRERYTMPILQQMQAQAVQAQLTVGAYEKDLFVAIKDRVSHYILPLRKIAESIAQLDALVGFAQVAYDQGYVCPQFNQDRTIVIRDGRHPVIARTLGHQFIPNDTQLNDQESLWIITGPNMGGKSTYLRQVALISILAQSGSFVPATAANLPLLDRIFTRIGAGDNLAVGKSTFLVEMEETAQICLQATKDSLVILDEVGRGTSTFDGLALAQAIVEYLYTKIGARCLFATHYHELTKLQDTFSGIVNYYADSKKTAQGILFLHKIVKGVAGHSFGLQVAKLAQLPHTILIRAEQLVNQFEHAEQLGASADEQAEYLQALDRSQSSQLSAQQALIDQLKLIDINVISPKQAFDLLWSLQEKIEKL